MMEIIKQAGGKLGSYERLLSYGRKEIGRESGRRNKFTTRNETSMPYLTGVLVTITMTTVERTAVANVRKGFTAGIFSGVVKLLQKVLLNCL